jgi:hypothetical protein
MLPPAEERRSANSNIDCYGTRAVRKLGMILRRHGLWATCGRRATLLSVFNKRKGGDPMSSGIARLLAQPTRISTALEQPPASD